MQDNTTSQDSQDQGLSDAAVQNEADGLDAVKRATEAALAAAEAEGGGEGAEGNPALEEVIAGAGKSGDDRGQEQAPKIVGMSDSTQALGDEGVAPVEEQETAETENDGSKEETDAVADKAANVGGAVVGARGAKKEIQDKVLEEVLKKIRDAENVLVTLSNDPSVDEMAAAIGLSIALDMVGKHATAIYSGKTPNVLEFLKPEETFEANANVLQDFVIALNKDKADHLRYKIEGDYVKVYVTPYKSLISEGDLEFSRGDYNVDLVIALNVPAATELDAALREYGRIMHDATSVNITNELAGKFGDVEWVDSTASSVSEMVARLAMELSDEMDAAVATALLTGIVAATDKFANQATTPEVMMLSAKLMGYGANQQAVFKNISQKLEFRDRTDVMVEGEAPTIEEKRIDTSKLTVGHNGFSDSVEGGEMEKYVDLNSDEREEGGKSAGIVGLGDVRQEVGGENNLGIGVGTDEMANVADELKAQQMGYENAVEETGAKGRGGILGSVQSVIQSVMNKNSAEGYEGSANGDTGAGAGFVVGEESGGENNSVVDEILNGLKKDEGAGGAGEGMPSSAPVAANGMPDYGRMIDEALNEKMPGEEGAEVPTAEVAEVEAPAATNEVVTGTPEVAVPVAPVAEAGAPSVEAVASVVPAVETPVVVTEVPSAAPVVGVEAGVPSVGTGVETVAAPATNDINLPLPGNELGVPPAPAVVDFNGLPQMPPVVEPEVASVTSTVGAVGSASNVTDVNGGGVAEASASEGGGVTAPVVQPAPSVTPQDPGQFRIPGQ